MDLAKSSRALSSLSIHQSQEWFIDNLLSDMEHLEAVLSG